MNAGTLAVRCNVRPSTWRERFDLEIHEVVDGHGAVIARAPVVDGWLQVDAAVRRLPNPGEERLFFGELAALRDLRGSADWFVLHKPPGLRLRFKLGDDRGREIEAILERVLRWRAPWLGHMALGSFFAQSELLESRYREAVDTILTAAADQLIEAGIARDAFPCLEAWAGFALAFVEHFIGDRWFAWEALGRFQRLRSHSLAADRSESAPVCELRSRDPRGILERLGRTPGLRQSAGFGASVALLQTLNYIFNMWAVDDVGQRAILERARTISAPELTR